MWFGGKERREIAHLAAQLHEQLWRGKPFVLPVGAPQYLSRLLEASSLALGLAVTNRRRVTIRKSVAGLMTAAGIAGALKQAQDGVRCEEDEAEGDVFQVELPDGTITGVSFAGGKNLLASTYFQAAGIGRQRRHPVKGHSLRGGPNEQVGRFDDDPGLLRDAAATHDSKRQWNVEIVGPLAAILRIVRSAWR